MPIQPEIRQYGNMPWISGMRLKIAVLAVWAGTLAACGETKTLRLEYRLASSATQEEPNLILAFKRSSSGQLEASFDSGSLPGSLNASVLRQLLEGCSLEQNELDSDDFPDASADTCEDLGLEIGQNLFASQAISTDSNAELGVSGDTAFLFVLFIYNADSLVAGANRCAMLKSLRVTDNLLSADNVTTSASIELELANRVSSNLGPDNQNCYPLL